MKLQTQIFIVLAMGLAVFTGCESGKFTRNISPQIYGRVLAADTRQPLAGVTVARMTPPNVENFGPVKDGQRLTQNNGVQTDADGRFVLAGKNVVAFFRQPGWWSVPVSFSCSGYEPFQKNYTGTNVTGHSSSGMPMVDAGDVVLQPAAR